MIKNTVVHQSVKIFINQRNNSYIALIKQNQIVRSMLKIVFLNTDEIIKKRKISNKSKIQKILLPL